MEKSVIIYPIGYAPADDGDQPGKRALWDNLDRLVSGWRKQSNQPC